MSLNTHSTGWVVNSPESLLQSSGASPISDPSLTRLQSGNHVVTWAQSGEVLGRVFDSDWAAVGVIFQANTFTTGLQGNPEVASLANGNFVVTWVSSEQDQDGNGVFGQIFSEDGTAVGAEFQINSYLPSNQDTQQVVGLTDGGFVVTWTSNGQDGSGNGVYAQEFTADGTRVGPEARVNETTAGNQSNMDLHALANGGYMPVWNDGAFQLERFDQEGVSGGEFSISTALSRQDPDNPVANAYNLSESRFDVAELPNGEFQVLWAVSYPGQRGNGAAYVFSGLLGPEDGITGHYTTMSVVHAGSFGAHVFNGTLDVLADGGASLTWVEGDEGFSYEGIPPRYNRYFARNDSNGVQIGERLHLNNASEVATSVLDNGNLAVLWIGGGGLMVAELAPNEIATGDIGIIGETTQDQTLTIFSNFTDPDGVDINSFAYQWMRDGADISGAIQDSYTLTAADLNSVLSVRLAYTDGNGVPEQIFSVGTDPVAGFIAGTTGDDSLNGTAFSDVLEGYDGNDHLQGLGGDDIIRAGDGVDSVNGGDGDDLILGGSTAADLGDLLIGGAGNDTIDGGAGDDQIYGQDGEDTLTGGDGDDILDGGNGNNSLVGGNGDDTAILTVMSSEILVTGSAQGLIVHSSQGSNYISNDTETVQFDGTQLSISQLQDLINNSGFAGNNVLVGNWDDDVMNGGVGDDTLAGAGGNDTLDGGTGDDRLYGGLGDDTLRGGHGVDDLNGGDGQDYLGGGVGNDNLDGGNGHDVLDGGVGNDRLDGGDGDDIIRGGDGTDFILGGLGDDQIYGGETVEDLADEIYGREGNDTIYGGYGNDTLRGDAGDDNMAGGFGADTVIGGTGDDILTGSAFSDLLFGGDGMDFVNGGFGHDRVNGGADADRFFHIGIRDHGSDWIQDFNAAEGDTLLFGIGTATGADFRVTFAHTTNAVGGRAGDDAIEEAFVIYSPTGQIMWALVDGAGQVEINIVIGGVSYDLLGGF